MSGRELSFVGVVPCAGASTRMGRPKALLELDGSTFLSRVVRALATGGCDWVIVVVADGDEEIADEARQAGAQVIVNDDPGEGPITSLRLAIADLDEDDDAIVYLPVDHPAVTRDTVSHLLGEATNRGAALTLPMRGEKRGHPAIFRRSLFAELTDPSLEGGARIVVHRHLDTARLVQVDDPGVTADIDTPDAYAELLAEHAADEVGP